jgi:hypothetical protein
MPRKSTYDIPVDLLVRIGDVTELIELGNFRFPWPYNAYQELPRMLREAADSIEKGAP